MKNQIQLRNIKPEDCEQISDAFKEQHWDKPTEQFELYLSYQHNEERDVIIADFNGSFAGYLTIKWDSDYKPFKDKGIPEIVDFNVLKKYQRKGIGTCMMDEAERRIKMRSPIAGIGVGVIVDYGAAQVLYYKRGYAPDGNGLCKDYIKVRFNEAVIIDHSLAFFFTKELAKGVIP